MRNPKLAHILVIKDDQNVMYFHLVKELHDIVPTRKFDVFAIMPWISGH